MRTLQRRATLHDGIVKEILRGSASTQIELENGRYEQGSGYVKESVTLRLDNPAQADGLEIGTKVAIFKDATGKTNLVRDGEWKASDSIKKTGKSGKEYDDGVTVIMGRCIGANLIKPKEGQTFNPFFTLAVLTKDHALHRISINNYNDEYNSDNIEKTMRNFKYFLANDEHSFIPFTGTFLTGKAYKEEETGRGKFKNKTYSYAGLLNGKNIISYDYQKYNAPEHSRGQEQEQDAADTSLSMDSEIGGDGFMNIPDGIDEELPFN